MKRRDILVLFILSVCILSLVAWGLWKARQNTPENLPLTGPKLTGDMMEAMTGMVLTPQADVDNIYDILEKTTKVLDSHGINYFIIAGTLLGAVRHSGLIPWDDDADIMIHSKDKAKLEGALQGLSEEGLSLSKHKGNHPVVTNPFYKVWKRDNRKRFGNRSSKSPHHHTYPFLDIFLYDFDVLYDRLVPKGKEAHKALHHKTLSFARTEVFPQQEYAFGPLKLKGPNTPIPYLERAFGPDFMVKAIQTHHHSKKLNDFKEIDLRKTPITAAWPTKKKEKLP